MSSEFPKTKSQYESTDVVYSVECSPITADVAKSHGWLKRGEWKRIPLVEGDGFGVPNAATDKRYPDTDLFTETGAIAIQHQFLAQQESSRIKWDTRIIKHKIKSTYDDTEIGIWPGSSSPTE